MSDKEHIIELLTEIRDNQRLSLQRQEEHLEVAKEQIERSRKQVQESIELQKLAIDRVKRVSRIAVPGIALCIILIIYLLIRYF
jgi:t-SNARE complex subunit (syntaxin)